MSRPSIADFTNSLALVALDPDAEQLIPVNYPGATKKECQAAIDRLETVAEELEYEMVLYIGGQIERWKERIKEIEAKEPAT